MPRQQVQLANEEIYHICLRSVGDTLLFKDEDDYFRGIFSLYEFNNTKPVTIWRRRRDRITEKKRAKLGDLGDLTFIDERDRFVEILAFCFMSNHIHLVLKQIKEGGISKFMQKVGGGYANHHNKKYKRKGHLFNQFRAFHISGDDQLKNVITYVHCNPISFINSGFKENGIKNPKKVIAYLQKDYRWSSLFDYLGKKNFSSITSREFILEVMGGVVGVKQAIENYILHKSEIAEFDYSVLE